MLCYWVAVSFYIPSKKCSVGVVWCGRCSCNRSLHVHVMLHSSEINFGCVAQGGFLQIPHYISYSYSCTAYGVWGIGYSELL